MGCSISEAWDGENLKFTFRRTVTMRGMRLWQELLQIASDIVFTDEPNNDLAIQLCGEILSSDPLQGCK
jgi:hypothetical protein